MFLAAHADTSLREVYVDMPEIKSSAVFVNALTKLLSVIVLVGLSLVVFAYRRSLEPLYGSAPLELHLGKVLWLSCILGSFAPTLPIWPVTLLGGGLLLAMPQSAYWVAVYTGRMGDPVWGPVITHVVVLIPVLTLGVAIVKALQVSLSFPLISFSICPMPIWTDCACWSHMTP